MTAFTEGIWRLLNQLQSERPVNVWGARVSIYTDRIEAGNAFCFLPDTAVPGRFWGSWSPTGSTAAPSQMVLGKADSNRSARCASPEVPVEPDESRGSWIPNGPTAVPSLMVLGKADSDRSAHRAQSGTVGSGGRRIPTGPPAAPLNAVSGKLDSQGSNRRAPPPPTRTPTVDDEIV